MGEFDDLRQVLSEASAARHEAGRALFREKQRLAQLRRTRATIARRGDGRAREEVAALDARIQGVEREIAECRGRLADAIAAEADRATGLGRLNDPRRAIGHFSDRTPILLLPLRIETRFKATALGSADHDELWVRAYPDDIAVDVFEDMPSESEAISARTYWANVWRAGGREADLRAAWRGLLAGQGAGRSRWMIENYRPLNEAGRPVPADGVPTLILVIVSQALLPAAEEAALAGYWSALWKADTDRAAQTAAATALVAAVGEARAAELVASLAPRNLADPPPAGADRAGTTVIVAILRFPSDTDYPLRSANWAQQPHCPVMPDRLVLLGWTGDDLTLQELGRVIPSPLAVGPDPSAEPEEQLRPDGSDLKTDPAMEWVTNFGKAVEVGMGFRVPLEAAAFRRGFDRLMVLGLCTRLDAAGGAAALQQLFLHHHHAKAGMSILPQGRPTNNVEGEGAAYSWQEDADVSYDLFFGPAEPDPAAELGLSDGMALARALGLDGEALRGLPFFSRADAADARAMNAALWPATGGYFLDAMLDTVISDRRVRQTREFFTGHVLARGPLPAIRIGKQPYGILPATVRSRIAWFTPSPDLPLIDGLDAFDGGDRDFLQNLYQLLRSVEADTTPLLGQVSWIGKGGVDPHQVLLDVVGLHAGSVEFQQRYAESVKELYNRMSLSGAGGSFLAAVIAAGYVASGMDLLERLGHVPADNEKPPDILEKLFLQQPNLLRGPLIDDVPLSETAPIRAYTTDNRNYIDWLITAAGTSHDALRQQEAFAAGPPTALLYLMLRHALDMSYVEVSRRLFFNAGLLSAPELAAARREPAFVGMEDAVLADPLRAGGSRWQYLYRSDAAITGSASRTVGAFIPTVITTMEAAAYLRRQLDALGHLRYRPTAVLERLLAEHVDLFTYRLDAWYGGLLSARLDELRPPSRPSPQPVPGTAAGQGGGIYLGAWGWLEGVRPEARVLSTVEDLPEKLSEIFRRPGEPPLFRDSANGGHILAPSLNHAVTAAVLRNGYLSNASPETPDSLAVNLTSERVRVALSMIEGMQNGQPLAALLGYRFERALHDRHDVEVDEFILDLRRAFPLVGNRLLPTRTGTTDGIGRRISMRRVEARNVIDGLALVEHLKGGGARDYPFGRPDLPTASPAQAAAISAEAVRLLDIADAVADLAMAESVHQVVGGNYERAAAMLAATSKGKAPQEPEVSRTPRSGVALTHRVALHLPVGIDPADPALGSPRARAEPAVNAWLAGLLPPLDRIACRVAVTAANGTALPDQTVTAADLSLLPIDLLYLIDTDSDASGRTLDDLIEGRVQAVLDPLPDATLAIHYRDRLPTIAGHVPFFELAALIRPLRELLLRSRPLRATDMTLGGEATETEDATEEIDPARVTLVRDELAGHLVNLEALRAPLQARLDAVEHAQIATEIDATLAAFLSSMQALAPLAPAETGTATLFSDRRRIFVQLKTVVLATVGRLDARMSEFEAAIAAFDADPPPDEEQRVFVLRIAERLIATARLDPLPVSDAAAFRDHLVNAQLAAMEAQRDGLRALHDGVSSVSALHDGIVAAQPVTAQFDPVEIDIAEPARGILILAQDMARRAEGLHADLTARVAAVDAALAAHGSATEARARVEALTSAARLMLGDSFQIVPNFALPTARASEWAAAWGTGPAADTAILDHLTATFGRRFPVEDWLTGVARVRPKLGEWEAAEQLSEAFTGATMPLQPLQFPHRPDTPWLGLEYPETRADGTSFAIDEDKLLYTLHQAAPFVPNGRQAGLLLDEWTEVIPSRTEDAGLTFHFDRPNSEPPQVLLLALSPRQTGAWDWGDLVDTVIETMDLARHRAIEPDHLDKTAYARFLPAVVSAVTALPITAAMNLSFNNGLAAHLAATGGGDE